MCVCVCVCVCVCLCVCEQDIQSYVCLGGLHSYFWFFFSFFQNCLPVIFGSPFFRTACRLFSGSFFLFFSELLAGNVVHMESCLDSVEGLDPKKEDRQ